MIQVTLPVTVLEKTEMGYKINREWIKRLREFTEDLERNVAA